MTLMMTWTALPPLPQHDLRVSRKENDDEAGDDDWIGYREVRFQVHGVDAAGQVVLRQKLSRSSVADKDDGRVPAEARASLEMLAVQLEGVKAQILENDRRIIASARATEVGRRLLEAPGIGPVLASAFVASVVDPAIFKSGRDLAAWIGLVPRQNSSGGKERLGGITKAGSGYLRQMLTVGAMAVIRYAQRNSPRRPWLVQLMGRRRLRLSRSPIRPPERYGR